MRSPKVIVVVSDIGGKGVDEVVVSGCLLSGKEERSGGKTSLQMPIIARLFCSYGVNKLLTIPHVVCV